MEILCEGLDLSNAILIVSRATTTKTPNAILEGIKIKAINNTLELSATDSELSIITTIKAEVYKEGEVVIPGSFFGNYLKRLTNEQIRLTQVDNKLRVSYSDSEGFIQCYDAKEFPKIQELENTKSFEIKQNLFKQLINKTTFAVATDDSRPILKGVLLEVGDKFVNAVALDGYRMAVVKKEIISSNIEKSIIVPQKTLREITNLLQDNEEPIKISVSDNFLTVNINGVIIVSRLIDGQFADYKSIIPSEFSTHCVVNKDQFESTLERVSLIAKFDKNNIVKFDMKENNILITSNGDIGNIKENLTVNLSGNDLVIAFNSRYFADILKVTQEEFIQIDLNTSFSPCIVKPVEGDEYIYLILPVRIANY